MADMSATYIQRMETVRKIVTRVVHSPCLLEQHLYKWKLILYILVPIALKLRAQIYDLVLISILIIMITSIARKPVNFSLREFHL